MNKSFDNNITSRLLKYMDENLSIHPSTKSPLAGAAWNFSQSQARHLCNAGLSVATSDKRWEI